MKKRILSFLLAVSMVCSMLPVQAFAAGTAIYLKPGDYWPSGSYDYAVWNWYDGYEGFWVEPVSQTPDENGWVSFEVSAPNAIFVAIREGAAQDWNNTIYKTADLVVDSAQVYYTLSSNTGGDWSDGSSCDHSYESTVTTPATCTSTGLMTYTCSKCGRSYTDTIAKSEHTLNDSGICTVCGAAPGLVFVSYTHLFPEEQFDCYAWVWPSGGEGRWVYPSSTQTVDGYTAFPVEENDSYVVFLIVPQWAEPSWNNRVTQTQDIFIDNTTYETLHGPYTQGALGGDNIMDTYSAEEPCAHSWSESTTASSGCTTEGRRIFDCANCDASANVVLPAAGHSEAPEELTVVTPATCTSDGSGTYICEKCQQSVSVTIPAAGHRFDENVVCGTCDYAPAVQCTYNGTVTYFDDLISAYRYSGNGTYSLKLLKDTTLNTTMEVYKENPMELDLNGHTLSAFGQSHGAIFLNGGDAVVRNGTIKIQAGSVAVFEIRVAKLTLTDVTFIPEEEAAGASCVLNTSGSCELNNVKVQGQVDQLLNHISSYGPAVLNNCDTYDPSLQLNRINTVKAGSGGSLTLNGGRYQYLYITAGVGTALQEGNWYREIADGTYVGEAAMAGSALYGVEIVPVPLIPTVAETATATLGSPLTLEPGYRANIQDFDSTALTVTWDYDEVYFEATQDSNTLMPTAAGETTVTCVYSYKGYTVTDTVTVTIMACTEHTFGESGFCTVCNAPEPAQDTDGDSYYEITNSGNLWWFTQQVNGGNNSLNAELTANIDLAGTCGEGIGNWQPIGNKYSGHFNGQGYTISNLYMSGDDQYIGLFGRVYGATIENVTVIGSVSSTFSYFLDPDNYVYLEGAAGGIVAYMDDGTIRNCHVDMSVVSGGFKIGGICGTMYDGLIEGCTVNGNIICKLLPDQGSGSYIGGIVGSQYGGTVCGCVNRATASAENSVYFGGIAGLGTGDAIKNCLNYGTFNAIYDSTYAGGTTAGGIVGSSMTVIRDCGNLGSINISGTGESTGGIVGFHQTSSSIVENCYNVGSITSSDGKFGVIVGATDTSAIVTNNYYLNDTATEDGGRTAEQFASGQVAYELNGSTTTDESVWKQTLGTDSYPTFSGEPVYYITLSYCDGTAGDSVYSNATEGDTLHFYTDAFASKDETHHYTRVCEKCCAGDEAAVAEHSFSGAFSSDAEGHWQNCADCGAPDTKAAHSYDNDCDTECNVCGSIRTITHQFVNGFCTVCEALEAPALLDDVYQIANGGNLFWFAQTVNGGDSDAKALVVADIDLENREWAPINGYTGTFDGAGHSITGLFVSEIPTSTGYKMGFFGTILSPAVVKNFTISGKVQADNGYPNAMGGVVAASGENDKANGGTVSGITSRVTLSTTAGKTVTHLGGVVGAMYGGSVSHCIYNGAVYYNGGTIKEMGGIVGYGQAGTIQYCANLATLTHATHAGGILGYVNNANTHVLNCYNYGKVSGSTNYTGAIIGRANSSCGTVEGNYYCSDNMTGAFGTGSGVTFGDTAATGKTAEAFTSGEVAWLLNGESSDGVWRQTLDGSSLPGFSGDAVYRNTLYICDGTAYTEYSNTQVTDAAVPPHQFDESGLCPICQTQAEASVTVGDTVTFHITFADAMQAADSAEDATVILLTDVTVSETITVSGDILLLDLESRTLKADNCMPLAVKDCTFVLTARPGGGIRNDSTYHTIRLDNSEFTMTDSVVIDANATAIFANASQVWLQEGEIRAGKAVSLDITGGVGTTVTVDPSMTLRYTEACFAVDQNSEDGNTILVDGGTFVNENTEGAGYLLESVYDTQMTISGGTFENGVRVHSDLGSNALADYVKADYVFRKADNTYINLAAGQAEITETVTVAPVPIHITVQPEGFTTTECKIKSLTLATDVTADTYTWYCSTDDGATFNIVESATGATIQPDVTAKGTFLYYCQVSKSGYILQSATATVQVDPCPHADGVDSSYVCNVCGDQLVATVTAGASVSYYDNFLEAVAAASAAETATITLLADSAATETATISGGVVTLELSGKTLDAQLEVSSGTLTIQDSIGGGALTNAYDALTIGDLTAGATAEVILKSGTIRSSTARAVYLKSGSYTQNGGTVTSAASDVYAIATDGEASGCIITITDGTVENTSDAFWTIYMAESQLSVQGGRIEGLVQIYSNSTVDISGGSFMGADGMNLMIKESTVTISGGTFEDGIGVYDRNFNDLPLADYLAAGYAYQKADGTCTVNAAMTSLTGTVTVVPAPWLAIDEKNFPDANFRTYVQENCDSAADTDTPGYLTDEELLAVKEMTMRSMGITSLEGIQHFTELETLICSGNALTELDVSNNTALTQLDCGSNQLTELDMSQNTKLTTLICVSNALTELDVSHNTALTLLSCDSNQLAELDMSCNAALTQLYCGNNQLTELDMSHNTALTDLLCNNNQLTSLDVSHNTALTDLRCHDNQLTSLDVSHNTALTDLRCYNNQLTSLDVSHNTALTRLDCCYNQLTSLDVSMNTALKELDCYDNQLTSLDLSGCTALEWLNCRDNQLTSLDISRNSALVNLDCSENRLTALDVSKNTALEAVSCYGNAEMTTLTLSGAVRLTFVDCHDSGLTTLDVSQLPALRTLDCAGNALTELNVSQNENLKDLRCNGNLLTTLDVSNNAKLGVLLCENNRLTALDLTGNTALAYFAGSGQTAYVTPNADGTADLSPLGDTSRMTITSGGNMDSNGIVTPDAGAAQIVYTYATGSEKGDLEVTVSLLATGIVSVDITWGAMEFTYSDGTWEADSLTYVGQGWTADTEDGNAITVTNTGSEAVTVSVSYTPAEGYTGISGTFGETSATLAGEEEKKFWLLLSGNPENEISGVPLGTVTVTIGGE